MEIQGELDSRFTLPKGEWVYPLGELTKEMSDYVGEKMATLGELRNRLGLKVPEGFVISTYAFKRFIETNRLEEWVAPLSEGKLNQEVMEEKAKELREQILRAKMPPEIKKAIRKVLPSWKNSLSGRMGGSQQRPGGRQSNQLCRSIYHRVKCSVLANRLGIQAGRGQFVFSSGHDLSKGKGHQTKGNGHGRGLSAHDSPHGQRGYLYRRSHGSGGGGDDPVGLLGVGQVGGGRRKGRWINTRFPRPPPTPFCGNISAKRPNNMPCSEGRGDFLGSRFSGQSRNCLAWKNPCMREMIEGALRDRTVYEILSGYRMVHRSGGPGHLSPGPAASDSQEN